MAGMRVLSGSSDPDVLLATAVKTALLGNGGNDTIDGYTKGDWLAGGLGDDTVRGAGGSDTYLYAFGDGNNSLSENGSSGDVDRLVLAAASTRATSPSLARPATSTTSR